MAGSDVLCPEVSDELPDGISALQPVSVKAEQSRKTMELRNLNLNNFVIMRAPCCFSNITIVVVGSQGKIVEI